MFLNIINIKLRTRSLVLLVLRARSSDLWCEAWLKYFLRKLHLGFGCTAGFLCVFSLGFWLDTCFLSGQKCSSLSLLLGSFLGLQRDLWLLAVVFLVGILHWFSFLLSTLAWSSSWWSHLLNWWLLSWLESINLDWISVLYQNYLLVVSWDNLAGWENLRMMVHQENVLLEWIDSLESHHGSLLGWVHSHLWNWCWQSGLDWLLLKWRLFMVAGVIILSMSNIMKIALVLSSVTVEITICLEFLFIIEITAE